mmetsp:Transcript_5090/g.12978  ORF Transcript_5090/g.12978 Transcript_5090/m.12978 type:complete len:121 (+) Transcript_5090:320-682(+)
MGQLGWVKRFAPTQSFLYLESMDTAPRHAARSRQKINDDDRSGVSGRSSCVPVDRRRQHHHRGYLGGIHPSPFCLSAAGLPSIVVGRRRRSGGCPIGRCGGASGFCGWFAQQVVVMAITA